MKLRFKKYIGAENFIQANHYLYLTEDDFLAYQDCDTVIMITLADLDCQINIELIGLIFMRGYDEILNSTCKSISIPRFELSTTLFNKYDFEKAYNVKNGQLPIVNH